MASLCSIWEALTDFIALRGSRGCLLSVAFNTLNISNTLRQHFANKLYRTRGRYTISIVPENVQSARSSTSSSTVSQDFSLMLCKAAPADFWKAVGVETLPNIPDIPLLASLLEILGLARGDGLLATEACQMLGMSQVYTIVERGVALGMIVKRTVMPLHLLATQAAHPTRVKSRTVILHIRRFANLYDALSDGAFLEAEDQMKVDISRYIKKMMKHFSRTSLAVTDIAAAIGCAPRHLRIGFADELQKKESTALRDLTVIELPDVAVIYPSRTVSKRMCVSLVTSSFNESGDAGMKAAQDVEDHSSDVTANSALYKQVSTRIRRNGSEGLLAHHIRIAHCLLPKRSDRLLGDLRTTYGYPVDKQQCGKQTAFKIYPQSSKRASCGENMITKSTQQKASAMTDLKSDRLDFIVELLKKEGGVVSVPQIVWSLRHDEAAKGVGFKAARKTVKSFLHQLETEGKITQISADLPVDVKQVGTDEGVIYRKINGPEMLKGGVNATVQLVVLTEADSPPSSSLVESFYQRIACDDAKRQQSLTQKSQKVRLKGETLQSGRSTSVKAKSRSSRSVCCTKDKSIHVNDDALDVNYGSDSAEHIAASDSGSDDDGAFYAAGMGSTKHQSSSAGRYAGLRSTKVQYINSEKKNAFVSGSSGKQKPIELAFNQLLRSFCASSCAGPDGVLAGASSRLQLKRKASGDPLNDQFCHVHNNNKAVAIVASKSSYGGTDVTHADCMLALDAVISGALATERAGTAPVPTDVVSPHEAILYSHMFSLGDAFGFVQMTTDVDESSLDGDGSSHDARNKQKKIIQRAENAGKEVQVAHVAVRCDLEVPVGTDAVLRMKKVLGHCHGGHYGPNLNRVHCELSTILPTGRTSMGQDVTGRSLLTLPGDNVQNSAKQGTCLLPGEVHCPWVTDAGQRHAGHFLSLRSKVIMFLGNKPGCDAQQLRALVLPHLTQDQVDILLRTLETDGFVCSREPSVSAKVEDPFITASAMSATNIATSRGYFLLL